MKIKDLVKYCKSIDISWIIFERPKDCPMRHENGNCLPCGGFCTSVNAPICEAIHNAYKMGEENGLRSAAKMMAGTCWEKREMRE